MFNIIHKNSNCNKNISIRNSLQFLEASIYDHEVGKALMTYQT